MKIAFTPQALSDLEEIAAYLVPRSARGALSVRTAILATLEEISRYPRMGRRQSIEPVRKISVRKYPYVIYYLVEDVAQEVVILSIRHGARQRIFEDK